MIWCIYHQWKFVVGNSFKGDSPKHLCLFTWAIERLTWTVSRNTIGKEKRSRKNKRRGRERKGSKYSEKVRMQISTSECGKSEDGLKTYKAMVWMAVYDLCECVSVVSRCPKGNIFKKLLFLSQFGLSKIQDNFSKLPRFIKENISLKPSRSADTNSSYSPNPDLRACGGYSGRSPHRPRVALRSLSQPTSKEPTNCHSHPGNFHDRLTTPLFRSCPESPFPLYSSHFRFTFFLLPTHQTP
jgi:hypothetical protein